MACGRSSTEGSARLKDDSCGRKTVLCRCVNAPGKKFCISTVPLGVPSWVLLQASVAMSSPAAGSGAGASSASIMSMYG